MASELGPVAELFATLGIDVSQLEAGLQSGKIKMEEFATPVKDTDSRLKQLSAAFNPNVLNAAFDQLTAKGLKFREQIDLVYESTVRLDQAQRNLATNRTLEKVGLTENEFGVNRGAGDAIDEMVASANLQRAKLAEAASYALVAEQQRIADNALKQALAEEAALEKESSLAVKEMAANREAANKAMMASDAERAKMAAMYATEQIEAEQKVLAEQEAAFKVYMEMLEAKRVANREAMAEDRFQAQQAFYVSQEGRSGGSGGIGNARNVAFMGQGIEQILGVRIPFGFNRILSILPQVQAAMMAAFDVLVAVAFVDILYQVGSKLVEITDVVNGWGEANRKAWAEATKDAIKANEELLKYQDRQRDRKNDNKVDLQGDLSARDRQIKAVMEEKRALDDLITVRGLLHDKAIEEGTPPALLYAEEKIRGLFEHENADLERQKQLQDQLNKLNKDRGDIIEKAEDQKNKRDTQKKWHDDIEQYPNRMPWFMGTRPEDVFSSQFGGPRANPPSSMPMFNQRSRPSSAPSSSGGAAGGHSVSVQPHYAPVFQFNGVPADIQRFMRDSAEPMLVADMQKNTRGITDAIVKVLKGAGI